MVAIRNGTIYRANRQSPLWIIYLPQLVILFLVSAVALYCGVLLGMQMKGPSIPDKTNNLRTGRSKAGWDNGWRSVDFFQGKLKPHDEDGHFPQDQVRFFGEGQDKAVVDLLNNKRKGTFVDLAANSAFDRSNTYSLEKYFGWSGICIEANQNFLEDLAAMRTCQVVVAAVGRQRMESVDFAIGGPVMSHSGLGGIVGDRMSNTPSKNIGQIKKFFTVPLQDVLERYDANHVIDYLSLDIEGAEYMVMEHFPFDRYVFRVITCERPDKKLMRLLNGAGYRIIKKVRFDVLYVHESALNDVNFSAIDVLGPDSDQTQTTWQLVPPVTTEKRWAITPE